MNCDCQHEGVCKHRLNIGVALDPILVKYFGGFEVNKDVWDFISSKCRFKQSKAAPVQQTTNAGRVEDAPKPCARCRHALDGDVDLSEDAWCNDCVHSAEDYFEERTASAC